MATKREVKAHNGVVSSCQYGGVEDELILSTSHDGGVRLWKEDSLEMVADYKLHTKGGWDRMLCCADLETEKLLWRVQHPGMVTFVDVRGPCVATVSDPDLVLRLWDSRTGLCVHEVFGLHESTISSCSISEDKIMTSSFDHTSKCYDLVSHKQTMCLKAHTCPILKGIVSTSSYVTASSDKSLCCWKLTGAHVLMQEGHHSCVSSCAFSPDGRTLASVGFDQRVALWDARSCSLLDKWTSNYGMLYDVDFGERRTLLIASGKGTIHVRSLSNSSKAQGRKETVRMECRTCHAVFFSTEIIGDKCVDCRLQRFKE